MQKIKLSILIPAYNTEQYIQRAINSIPDLPNIEVIIRDDGSTDDTYQKILDCIANKHNYYCEQNNVNMGVGYTRNALLESADGEYIVWLDSDDHFIPGTLERFIQFLDGTDLIYYDLITNDGVMLRLSKNTREAYCGTTKFIRRDFIGATRYPEIKVEEDKHFFNELIKKSPTEHYTNLLLIQYNWPRVGSLCYLKERGEIKCQ